MSTAKRRGLGRGLDALLGMAPATADTTETETNVAPAEKMVAETQSVAEPEANASSASTTAVAGGQHQLDIDLIRRGR
ncbi:MAG: hypothetical protein U9Q75_06900, partial [Pseudomonadota bacterium]|nr:hypothetical protein [Pseudomonadota bacterium]